jgi:hypothetical protein
MSDEIINKVASSPLISIDLEEFHPKDSIIVFDLKHLLFMELILKEKEFRGALQVTDWSIYRNKTVAITCSADAIIPVWAYMLVTSYLQPLATDIIVGDERTAASQVVLKKINGLDPGDYVDKRVVIKGCGDVQIDPSAYAEITRKLLPVVKSIMYGEPCSTVPVYKKK